MYKSVFGQDSKVIDDVYKHKKNGYFVEIGAYDGIALSNTYLLETQYAWSGICIEPIPEKYEQLVKNRKAICSSKALYSMSGLELVFDNATDAMLSGISSHIDCHKHIVNRSKKQITVETLTLTDLLDQHNAPKFIEYMSLDVEGSELEVLRGLDFNRYQFGLIHTEHNYCEPRRSQIRHLLTSNGYEYIGANQFDDEYKLKI
jgi:FkbM family methyltransferase